MLERLLKGDHRAISRSISLVENNDASARQILVGIKSRVGNATIVGVTGPPGAGKSTLVNRLALAWHSEKFQVAVVAVDPTSPFTGGALLGDRLRMDELNEAGTVFVRSMASRGLLGGLSVAVPDVIDILDAGGKSRILVETVGVGQSEIEIASLSHCVVLVISPESGDFVQAMKSGLMEAADIVVINKCDRAGAESLQTQVLDAVSLYSKRTAPKVLLCSALVGTGVADVAREISLFITQLQNSPSFSERKKKMAKTRIILKTREQLNKRLAAAEKGGLVEQAALDVIEKNITTSEAAEELLRWVYDGKCGG